MSKRDSSLISVTAASAMLRSMAASSFLISSALATCALSLPMLNKFCKVIFFSLDPHFRTCSHVDCEALTISQARCELGDAHRRRVHLAAQCRLRFVERDRNIGKARATEHHDIDVAARAFSAGSQ